MFGGIPVLSIPHVTFRPLKRPFIATPVAAHLTVNSSPCCFECAFQVCSRIAAEIPILLERPTTSHSRFACLLAVSRVKRQVNT